jgi:hypothetical protein
MELLERRIFRALVPYCGPGSQMVAKRRAKPHDFFGARFSWPPSWLWRGRNEIEDCD